MQLSVLLINQSGTSEKKIPDGKVHNNRYGNWRLLLGIGYAAIFKNWTGKHTKQKKRTKDHNR